MLVAEKNSKSPSDTTNREQPTLNAPKTAKARESGQLRKKSASPPLIDFGSSATAAPAIAPAKKSDQPKKKEWDDDAWDMLNN